MGQVGRSFSTSASGSANQGRLSVGR